MRSAVSAGRGSKPASGCAASALCTSASLGGGSSAPSCVRSAYARWRPTDIAGPDWIVANATPRERDAASGITHPAWLPPESPIRAGSTSARVRSHATAATASAARFLMLPLLGSLVYLPVDARDDRDDRAVREAVRADRRRRRRRPRPARCDRIRNDRGGRRERDCYSSDSPSQ